MCHGLQELEHNNYAINITLPPRLVATGQHHLTSSSPQSGTSHSNGLHLEAWPVSNGLSCPQRSLSGPHGRLSWPQGILSWPWPGGRLPGPPSGLPLPECRVPWPGGRLPGPPSGLPLPEFRLPWPSNGLPLPKGRLSGPPQCVWRGGGRAPRYCTLLAVSHLWG